MFFLFNDQSYFISSYLSKKLAMKLFYTDVFVLPIAVKMVGGYARDVEDTVDIHFQTVKNAVCMLNH